jgi:act minimal PKS acyl carrier protein
MTEVSPQTILDILASEAGCFEVGERSDAELYATPLAELGYDSLAVMELIATIERRYAISLPREAEQEMHTPDSAASFINHQIRA